MKLNKMFSVMAVTALLVTLSMPFAADAKTKKHHGKKAHHSTSHKTKKGKKAKTASAPESADPAASAPVEVADPAGAAH